MSAGHSSTGISPRPMLMGAPRNALRAFNAGVSLSCLYVVAHKPPRLFFGPVKSLRFPAGERIMAHLPHGSAQTECVRLPYDAPLYLMSVAYSQTSLVHVFYKLCHFPNENNKSATCIALLRSKENSKCHSPSAKTFSLSVSVL